MGFDDLDWASHSHPALTTINLPITAMGVQAAQSMVQYLDDKNPIENIKLSAEIVQRDTVKAI